MPSMLATVHRIHCLPPLDSKRLGLQDFAQNYSDDMMQCVKHLYLMKRDAQRGGHGPLHCVHCLRGGVHRDGAALIWHRHSCLHARRRMMC